MFFNQASASYHHQSCVCFYLFSLVFMLLVEMYYTSHLIVSRIFTLYNYFIVLFKIAFILIQPLAARTTINVCVSSSSSLTLSFNLLKHVYLHSVHRVLKKQKGTRNKSNDYFESLQYWQDVCQIAHYHKRKHFPSYTRSSENHNNACAENRKIRGLKFDTLYWRHLAAYRKIWI